MSPYKRFDNIFSYLLKQEDDPLFALIFLTIFHFITLVFFSLTKIRLAVQISLFVFIFILFLKNLDGITLAFAFSRSTGKCTVPIYCDLPFNVLKNADYWLCATTVTFLSVAFVKFRNRTQSSS